MMLWHERTLHHTHSDIRYVGPSCVSTSLNHLNQYLIFRSDTTMQGVMEVPMCFVQICSTDSIFSTNIRNPWMGCLLTTVQRFVECAMIQYNRAYSRIVLPM